MERNNLIKKGLVVAVILLFVSVSVIPSTGTTVVNKPTISTFHDGNTLYVGGNGTGNYTKIQDAINDASVGDTVFVYKDSSPYDERLIINKLIVLEGEDRNSTIIDGEFKGSPITVFADNVTIKKFFLRNVKIHCGVIQAENCTNLKVIGNRIFLNKKGVAGKDTSGIYLHSCINSYIYNNVIYNFFGEDHINGIWIDGSDCDNNNISGNEIYRIDFGIQIGKPYVEHTNDNNIIYGNYIHYTRIGLWIYDGNNKIINNTIFDCHGVGIELIGGEMVVSNNLIEENGFGGAMPRGGICVDSPNNIISGNIVTNNCPTGILIEWDEVYGNNTIINNYISNSTVAGIVTESQGKDQFTHNYITAQPYGIVLDYSDNNIVTDNHISNNTEVGAYTRYGINNLISRNNLIDNGVNAYFDIYYPLRKKNNWNENYWSDCKFPDKYPKFIRGTGHLFFFLGLKWLAFDWHPAQEPYDIGV